MQRSHVVVALVGCAVLAAVAFASRPVRESASRPQERPRSVDAAPSPSHARRSPAGGNAPHADAPVDPRIAAEPADAVAAYLHAPVVVHATVSNAEGGTPEREGARCRVGVERLPVEGRCRAVVECGLTRLVGAPPLHDVECTFGDGRLRTLRDGDSTAGDRDAAFELDVEQRRLRVRDDRFGPYGAYVLDATLDS